MNLAEVAEQAVEMAAPALEGRRHELSVTLPRKALRVEGDVKARSATTAIGSRRRLRDRERSLPQLPDSQRSAASLWRWEHHGRRLRRGAQAHG